MIENDKSKKELSRLPNIEKVLSGRLRLAGIETVSDLRTIGTENIFFIL